MGLSKAKATQELGSGGGVAHAEADYIRDGITVIIWGSGPLFAGDSREWCHSRFYSCAT